MRYLLEIFSNRELATLIWLGIFVIGIQFHSPTRKASAAVLRAFFKLSIITIVVLAIIYSSSVIYFLFVIGFWDQSLLKETIFWFVGSGFIVLMNLTKIGKEEGFFKEILRDNLKLILILEFVIHFHQFSLTSELILLPVLIFLTSLMTIAEREEHTKIIKTIIEWIFAVAGLAFLIISITDIIRDINEFASFSTLNSFMLPVILSIAFIPCAYVIALFMNYEVFFVRLGMFLTNKNDLRYAKWRTMLKCHISLKKLRILSPQINSLHHGSTRQEMKEIIS